MYVKCTLYENNRFTHETLMGWETFRLETMLPIGQVRPGTDSMLESNTVELDLIATEMLVLP